MPKYRRRYRRWAVGHDKSRKATNKRAMGIPRVSTAAQKDNHSVAMQHVSIREHARQQRLELAAMVAIDESAKLSSERSQFHAALARAKREKIQHLIFDVYDRATRNHTGHEQMEHDVKTGLFVLHIANDGRVFDRNTSEDEWQRLDEETQHNKRTIRDMRRRARIAAEEKVATGLPSNKAPFGYRNVPVLDELGMVISDRQNTVELEPWGRPVLRRTRELRIERLTLTALGRQVVAEFPDLSTKARRALLNRPTVDNILKNPFYMGWFRYAGELHQGSYETVFTEDEWHEMQQVGRKDNERVTKNKGLFSGSGLRLVCADERCGCLITYAPVTKPSGKRYDYSTVPTAKGYTAGRSMSPNTRFSNS